MIRFRLPPRRKRSDPLGLFLPDPVTFVELYLATLFFLLPHFVLLLLLLAAADDDDGEHHLSLRPFGQKMCGAEGNWDAHTKEKSLDSQRIGMFSFRSICACRVFFLSSASIIFRINIIVIIIHFSLTALLLFIDNLLSEDVEGGRQVLTEERGFFLFALSFRREGKSMALVSVLPSRHSRLTCSIASRVPVSVQRRPPAVSQKNPKVTK